MRARGDVPLAVVAAALAFSNLAATTTFLATFLGVMIGAVLVVQGAGTIALAFAIGRPAKA